jgi:hypothetical protein
MDDDARFCPACGQPTELAVQTVYATPQVPIQPQPQPIYTAPPVATPTAAKAGSGSGTLWYLSYGFLFVLSMILLIIAGIPFKWALCMFLLFTAFGLVLVLALQKGGTILRVATTLLPTLVAFVTLGASLLGWLAW